MTGWLDQAACRGRPTDWWYPGQGDRFTQRVAQLVCQGCPVRADCLAAALVEEGAVAGEPYGIRGGLTAEARSDLARQVAPPVVSVASVERNQLGPTRPGWAGRHAWPRRQRVTPM